MAGPAAEQLGEADADGSSHEGELGEGKDRDLLAIDGEGDVPARATATTIIVATAATESGDGTDEHGRRVETTSA